MAQHVGSRVSDDLHKKLDFMRQLKGYPTISDLVREYVEQGLERDAKDIETQVEERLAAERQRMTELVAALSAPATPDSEDVAAEQAATA